MATAQETETSLPDLPGAKALTEALHVAFREKRFSGLLVLDIDDFSSFNRMGERGVGDRILSSVSHKLRKARAQCFRVAGDDFVIVYTGSRRLTPEILAARAETLRESVAEGIYTDTARRMTLSAGGVAHPGAEYGDDERMADLVTSTAEALVIRAKKLGKDRSLVLPQTTRAPAGVLVIMMQFYRELARINHSVAEQRESESRIDPLTGLHNRRAFDETLDRMFRVHQRTGHPFAVISIDSDRLKEINDTGGHDAGDRFLLDLTRVLRETVRSSDLCSRWGGDEFAILADRLSLRSAHKLAERIRRTVDDRTDGTVSVGLFFGSPKSAAAAVKAADNALYRAKKAGKNRVVVDAAAVEGVMG